jgi:D-3-phosphoglycerate dehydrogenase|tara:strand:+ start:193 stop:1203 length:1011 start_codon:yes stop_codon:yes gene_type:complete
MTWKVLITDYVWPTIDPERKIIEAAGGEVIVAPDSSEETLITLAKDADAIMTCFANVTANVIKSAKKCVVISRFGVGVDNISVSKATELGIPVTNIPDYCIDEVSDHVLALLTTWNRKIALFDKSVKENGWDHLSLSMRIMRLRDKTLGIVGFGRIGQMVAQKASAFGMKIVATDPVMQESIMKDLGVYPLPLNELLQSSDFVTLHAPLIPQTHNLIGEKELNMMKSDAFIINAARGPLIDEEALYKALKKGVIAGAGLDVMVDTIPEKTHPLLQLDNILITPHIAFFSQESTLELEMRTAQEVVRVLNNSMPENLINPEVLTHPNPRHNIQIPNA